MYIIFAKNEEGKGTTIGDGVQESVKNKNEIGKDTDMDMDVVADHLVGSGTNLACANRNDGMSSGVDHDQLFHIPLGALSKGCQQAQ